MNVFAALVVKQVVLEIISQSEEYAALEPTMLDVCVSIDDEPRTYSLVRCSVAIGASNALVVGSSRVSGKNNGSNSELEHLDCVRCEKINRRDTRRSVLNMVVVEGGFIAIGTSRDLKRLRGENTELDGHVTSRLRESRSHR